MKNFLQLKLDMEVGIDGMLANETKKSAILKEFLIIILRSFRIRTFYYYIFRSNSANFSKRQI